MKPEVRDVALAYAAEHYGRAELVVVAGSAAKARRPRSDIDLLIVGPAAMFRDGHDEAAHTDRWHGELFEVFAGTPDAYQRHQIAGVERLRPVSGFLLLDGVVVLDQGIGAQLTEWTRTLFEPGPSVTARELDARRYAVTNTLDDLLDAVDPTEVSFLSAMLFQRLGELLLLAHGQWVASGRHLIGRLRDLDPDLAAGLEHALTATDVPALERYALAALEPLGGRLLDGYVR